jgi:putative nucleotidyltransferase with HDIG domain
VNQAVRTFISKKVRSDKLEVPVLPYVAQKIMTVINDPNVSVDDIGGIVHKDQQLSARMIKIANSPVYSRGFEIKSVKTAVLTIGLKAVHEIALAVAMGEKVFRSKLFGKRMIALWNHSLAVAYLSRHIAKIKNLNSGYAFLCGLMHDVGKPLILLTLEQLHKRFEGRLMLSNEMVDDLLFDFHPDVGALMGSAWKFPTILRDTIRYHHRYSEAQESQKAAHIVHVADLFAMHQGKQGYVTYEPVNPLGEKAVDEMEFTDNELRVLSQELPKKIDEVISQFQS